MRRERVEPFDYSNRTPIAQRVVPSQWGLSKRHQHQSTLTSCACVALSSTKKGEHHLLLSLVKEEVYTRSTSNAFNDLKRLRMLDDNAFRCLRTNAVRDRRPPVEANAPQIIRIVNRESGRSSKVSDQAKRRISRLICCCSVPTAPALRPAVQAIMPTAESVATSDRRNN
jgi:hypothetical protein